MQKKRLELHHLGSRNNSELTCTLCVSCHISISNRQMVWDSRWTCNDNTGNVRSSFIVEGVYELLLAKHAITGDYNYRAMADALPSLIRYYRDDY